MYISLCVVQITAVDESAGHTILLCTRWSSCRCASRRISSVRGGVLRCARKAFAEHFLFHHLLFLSSFSANCVSPFGCRRGGSERRRLIVRVAETSLRHSNRCIFTRSFFFSSFFFFFHPRRLPHCCAIVAERLLSNCTQFYHARWHCTCAVQCLV